MNSENMLCCESGCVDTPISTSEEVTDERLHLCLKHARKAGLMTGIAVAQPFPAPAPAPVVATVPAANPRKRSNGRTVVLQNQDTMVETTYASVAQAADAIDSWAGNLYNAVLKGGLCKGYRARFKDGEFVVKARKGRKAQSARPRQVAAAVESIAEAPATSPEVIVAASVPAEVADIRSFLEHDLQESLDNLTTVRSHLATWSTLEEIHKAQATYISGLLSRLSSKGH